MQVISKRRRALAQPGEFAILGEDGLSPATGLVHRYPDRCCFWRSTAAPSTAGTETERLVGGEDPIAKVNRGSAPSTTSAPTRRSTTYSYPAAIR